MNSSQRPSFGDESEEIYLDAVDGACDYDYRYNFRKALDYGSIN